MSIVGWIEKGNVIYTYNGVLFNLKKEGNSAISLSNKDTKNPPPKTLANQLNNGWKNYTLWLAGICKAELTLENQ